MTSETKSTLDILRAAVAHYGDVDAEMVTPESTMESLGIDSLGLIEILFYVEDAIGIQIEPPKVRPNTVAELVALIDGQRSEG